MTFEQMVSGFAKIAELKRSRNYKEAGALARELHNGLPASSSLDLDQWQSLEDLANGVATEGYQNQDALSAYLSIITLRTAISKICTAMFSRKLQQNWAEIDELLDRTFKALDEMGLDASKSRPKSRRK